SGYLDGGAGADTMAGGAGNDYYYVDNTGDVVTEALNAGIDTIDTTLTSYTLGDNLENLTFGTEEDVSGTGNMLDNYIIDVLGHSTLSGQDGNDTLLAWTSELHGDAG